jgi:tetratricopeptide (TPR) repeat protein
MVSIRCAVLVMAAGASLLPARQAAPKTDQTQPVAPAPAAGSPLTPEQHGDIYMARKMYREAIAQYKEAPKTSSAVWNKMGIACHQLNELDAAKKNYERAIKLDPRNAEAINNLGTVYYARRDYRRAISQYNKALKYAPDSASIYSNMGTAWFARKNYPEAAAAYQKAIALDPDVFEHRDTHGVLIQERRVEDRARFHFYMAKTYAKARMNDRALEYMRKALEEGFKDREKFNEDPDFAALKDLPEFKDLLAREPRVL